ncbi:hypothetical protein LLE49_24310 [Alicyclobacillus tolerans]|uniref:hypothetical protein n=1 Tax=Alicyclobacillus tolerans TaxID=90970 RepID=UPI001F245B95|nr:hypothetical protein [Alicyclobacillus tolerans]MCF8567849.1 hypothetical protein [Alicyclobacillus tolerans]
MISAFEAKDFAVEHMSQLIEQGGLARTAQKGTWVIAESQLTTFMHSSMDLWEGPLVVVSDQTLAPLVYRVDTAFMEKTWKSSTEHHMIISVDAETGHLRGYQVVTEKPKKSGLNSLWIILAFIAGVAVVLLYLWIVSKP